MNTIYKYKIDPYNPEIEMPYGAEILTAACQGGDFCIWANIDTDAHLVIRNIHIFGTGHEIPQTMGVEYEYINTGFMSNGLVFHAYERKGL